MNTKQKPLDRLLRSAAADSPEPDAVVDVPWSLEQRVLAALRAHRNTEDLSWLGPFLRHVFTAAGALIVVVGFLALHSQSDPATNAAPSHELAAMDQELTLALVPSSTNP